MIGLPNAFGTAGVRGIFNESQTPEQVYELGRAAADVYGKGRYCIGWDGRKSSFLLSRAVMAAVTASEGEAVAFGMVPTPVLAFGTRREGELGFSVTASHNPREFSGVKMFNGDGMELPQEDEAKIEAVLAGSSVGGGREKEGGFGDSMFQDVLGTYKEAVITRFRSSARSLKIVVDCANGPGGLVTPYVLRSLGHRVLTMNSQVSWRFPARIPEPTAESLVDTRNIVKSVGADIGFAHDGDADRLVMINPAGEVIPDAMLSIMVLKGLGLSSGSIILSENTSSAVEEEAGKMGLRVIRSRVGKSFTKIKENGALFASEPNKIVEPSWGLWEDGMYIAALISDLLSDAEVFASVKAGGKALGWRYKQVNLDVAPDFSLLIQRAEATFAEFQIMETRTLDGLRLNFRDGSWVMFRKSGTEPKVRIYCESRDDGIVNRVAEKGIKLVKSVAK